MRRFLRIAPVLIIAILLLAFKPEAKFLKKAEQSIEKGNLKNAKSYYLRALAKNPDSYDANLGIGLMLCELLDNHNEALPYLETALRLSGKDTLKDLEFALAQCYQYKGDYEKAIQYYKKLDGCVDYDNEIDLSKELQKRIDDCTYAIAHKVEQVNDKVFVVNAGRTINTEMPEYVPVLTPESELIFTSKRKDTPNEEINYLDGKYFESMYITKIDSSGYTKVRRYTIPDYFFRSHFAKHHESIISISPDGKKLFTFKDNKIYEIGIKERVQLKPKKLLKTINFNYYQNHAYVSKDGKTLLFTSDASSGLGGNDIYESHKNEKGDWGKPVNLGSTINTSFDEEAPYLTDDGLTLYFSSRGHQGYGNFDIYKSNLIDGKWTTPENLGEPINSPGHDIFMIHDSSSSIGYFSSSRNGGFGDMDIYKLIYLDKIDKQCPTSNKSGIALTIKDENLTDYRNTIETSIPANYRILSYEWNVNDIPVQNNKSNFENDYTTFGKYLVNSKIVALCDTCLTPIISCLSVENEFKDLTILAGNTVNENELEVTSLKDFTGALSDKQLTSIGFNTTPLLFDFNKIEIRNDALEILAPNIEVLLKNPDLKIDIIGYSDVRGAPLVNKIVSYLRANNVRKSLLKNGVKNNQIKSVTGKGASDFVVDCNNIQPCDENAHQQNRRVVLVISK